VIELRAHRRRGSGVHAALQESAAIRRPRHLSPLTRLHAAPDPTLWADVQAHTGEERGHPVIAARSWGDTVYVRGFPTFEKLEPRALLKLAAILHENYGSYDLAARVLDAFDAKTRSQLYPRYARLMTS